MIRQTGYMKIRKDRRDRAVETVSRLYPILLDGHLDKISDIELRFFRHISDWKYGINYLWNEKTKKIIIRLPENFLNPVLCERFVRHELGHTIQLMENRLTVGDDRVFFRPRNGPLREWIKKNSKEWWSQGGEVRVFPDLPWEVEVRDKR